MNIIINPKYVSLSPFIQHIPNNFDHEGELIYEARNRLKAYQADNYAVIVKSFKKPIFINRIIYTFFRPSKAKRSYEYAFRLLEKDILTPEPIAYIEEKKCGLLSRSYYISIFEKDTEHIRAYMSGEKKDDVFMDSLAEFIAGFHSKGIYHLDMSPGNILFKKSNDTFVFMLVDINRMKFKEHISENERYKSFRRLSSNAGVIQTLAEKYAGYSNLDKQKAIAEIKKECSNFFKKPIV